MTANSKTSISIETTVLADIEKVWSYWNEPKHIMQWNHASDDWHTTSAENDLKVGGKLKSHMAAKDGSFGFDFEGFYDEVVNHKRIAYHLADDRNVLIEFTVVGNSVHIKETFDAETENSVELQRNGWQAILDNFKKYVEGN